MSIPRAPAGMGAAGRRLWKSVLSDFEFGGHEQLILVQACHVADTCEDLQAVIDRDGPMLASPDGPRLHPACRELRQQRITLGRLVVSLRVPLGDEDADDGRGGQHRGTRGFYPGAAS